MAKIIDVDFRTKEQKRADFVEEVKTKFRNTGEWISHNKEIAIPIAIIGARGAVAVIKATSKRAALHKEELLKDCYCYDRSLGHYWQLSRKLTNEEWLEIDARKKAGERLSDILAELKVLK